MRSLEPLGRPAGTCGCDPGRLPRRRRSRCRRGPPGSRRGACGPGGARGAARGSAAAPGAARAARAAATGVSISATSRSSSSPMRLGEHLAEQDDRAAAVTGGRPAPRRSHSATITSAGERVGEPERELEHRLGLQVDLAAGREHGDRGLLDGDTRELVGVDARVADEQRRSAPGPSTPGGGGAVAATPIERGAACGMSRRPGTVSRPCMNAKRRGIRTPVLAKSGNIGDATTTSAPRVCRLRGGVQAARRRPRAGGAQPMLDDRDLQDASLASRSAYP